MFYAFCSSGVNFIGKVCDPDPNFCNECDPLHFKNHNGSKCFAEFTSTNKCPNNSEAGPLVEKVQGINPSLPEDQCSLCKVDTDLSLDVCLDCSANFENCISCIAGYDNFNQYCYLPCETNEFRTVVGSCAPCPVECESCNSLTECTACVEYHDLDVGTGSCILNCPPGKSSDGAGSCHNCPLNCDVCTTSPSVCDTCSGVYVLMPDNSCVDPCSGNFYMDGMTCVQCVIAYNVDCQECDINACTRCKYPKILFDNAGTWECIDQCAVGYFEKPTPAPICLPCNTADCKECSSIELDGVKCNECMSLGDRGLLDPSADQYLFIDPLDSSYNCVPACDMGYVEVTKTNGVRECQKCLIDDCKF